MESMCQQARKYQFMDTMELALCFVHPPAFGSTTHPLASGSTSLISHRRWTFNSSRTKPRSRIQWTCVLASESSSSSEGVANPAHNVTNPSRSHGNGSPGPSASGISSHGFGVPMELENMMDTFNRAEVEAALVLPSARRRRLVRPKNLEPVAFIPVTASGFGPSLSVDDMTRSLYDAEDPLWDLIRREAQIGAMNSSQVASYLHASILNYNTLEDSLSVILSHQLRSDYFLPIQWMELFQDALQMDLEYRQAIRRDLLVAMRRDPASTHPISVLLFNKGYQALQCYRLAHWLWIQNRKSLALYLQSTISAKYGVDIHPAAQIGLGILIDHATGIVIGETAVIGDDCSILHNVTLGGTGKEIGDRHPKIGRGVLIGAGVSILGNIQIGDCCRLTPGSVVLKPVLPYSVMSGVPARKVGDVKLDMENAMPSEEMQHFLDLSDSESVGIDGVGI
mmetsp:Transcript_13508/g.23032  ORF Transcript_13508/g.23032 Transcript_13508/m.23032 type:complete len:452 (+) Transcript_13508:44-1399(+)